jgi:hypothetical protein
MRCTLTPCGEYRRRARHVRRRRTLMLFDANILLYAANHGSTAADQCQLTSTDVLPLRAEQVAGPLDLPLGE